jgi:hypothetical protein
MGKMNWSQSVLSRVGGPSLSHCYFTKVEQQNVLRISISRSHLNACKTLLGQLPDNMPLGLRANNIENDSDGCLNWRPGQQEASANCSGSSVTKLAGCFMVFLPNQEFDALMMVEDGFIYHLRDSTWESIKSALLACEDILIKTTKPGSCDLQIRWLDNIAEKPPKLPVSLDQVELVELDQMNKYPNLADSFVSLIQEVEQKTQEYIKPGSEPLQFCVQIELSPCNPPKYEFSARPVLPSSEQITSLKQALAQIASPPVPMVLHINLDFEVQHIAV